MNNIRPYGPRDEVSGLEGDTEFVGVDERTAPQQLPAGYVASATNKRFRRGRAETRGGNTILPWAKGNGLTAFENPLGAFVYNDPVQSGEWFIIAAEGKVWKTRPNTTAVEVPLPMGVTLTAETFRKFIQANGSIVLLRGLVEAPLRCDNLDQGFTPIVQTNQWDVTLDAATNRVGLAQHNLLIGDPVRFSGSGLPAAITADQTYYVLETPNADEFTVATTPGGDQATWNVSDTDDAVSAGSMTVLDGAVPIPPSEDGFFIGNRLALVVGKDTVAVSDIGDFTRYAPIPSTFRINAGDSYVLKAIYPSPAEDTVLFLKSGNVKKVTGISDLSTAQGPLNVTESYGSSGRSVCDQGKDVFWLNSELRVTSLGLTQLNQTQATNYALSDRLVQTFARINPQYADKARLAIHDGYLRVALPLDEAVCYGPDLVDGTYPNVVALIVSGFVVGKTYSYEPGNATSLHKFNAPHNDAGVMPGEFVAETTTYLLRGTFGEESTAIIRQVIASGVNTGIAVYDFQARTQDPDTGMAGAWAGVDEASAATAVVDWLKFTLWGKQRLGFLGADGLLHLCDDGFDDERIEAITPYTDIFLDATTVDGATATIQVNGGDVITPSLAAAVNVGTTWGINGTSGGQNLFSDADGNGGFDPASVNPWSAPDTVASQIDGGVRFTATNGIVPAVVKGADSTVFVDDHDTPAIMSVPIVDRVRTRAYLCRNRDMKRYTVLAGQIATWSPSYTIRTMTQGVNTEEVYAENQTRDRLKYFSPHDKPDFDPSNAGDDYNAPSREDYSCVIPDLGIEMGSGIAVDVMQEYLHRATVNERGLWMQMEIENAVGRLELIATAMEAQEGEILSGVAIS